MVAAALDRPGLRLTAAELIALRPPLRSARARPASRRPGAIPARTAGQGMDLREIRAFSDGDDIRRIDPAATARTGQLHVRSFHEDRDDTTLLVADFRHAMLWGTGEALRSVRAARHLARLGWEAVARGGSVGLLVATDDGPASLQPNTGAAQMQALAVMLAARHDAALGRRGKAVPLAPVIAQAQRIAPPGSRVHLATGPDGLEGTDAALARLARGRSVAVHLILDPAESAPPGRVLSVSAGGAARRGLLGPHDPAPQLAALRSLGIEPHAVAS